MWLNKYLKIILLILLKVRFTIFCVCESNRVELFAEVCLTANIYRSPIPKISRSPCTLIRVMLEGRERTKKHLVVVVVFGWASVAAAAVVRTSFDAQTGKQASSSSSLFNKNWMRHGWWYTYLWRKKSMLSEKGIGLINFKVGCWYNKTKFVSL